MGCIDAEKLKSLLDAKYKDFREKAKIEGYTTLQYQYMADGIDIAEQFIDSLQQEQPEVFDTIAFQKGVKEGKRLMMEGAEECELYWDGDFLAIDLNMRELGYSERDKVNIIILPKEV